MKSSRSPAENAAQKKLQTLKRDAAVKIAKVVKSKGSRDSSESENANENNYRNLPASAPAKSKKIVESKRASATEYVKPLNKIDIIREAVTSETAKIDKKLATIEQDIFEIKEMMRKKGRVKRKPLSIYQIDPSLKSKWDTIKAKISCFENDLRYIRNLMTGLSFQRNHLEGNYAALKTEYHID
ncbi:hypothetical protein O3M35_000821 [Rhynocoris fuscipes]|uniref:Uncharacterized protein n=1 Tax=Rhynocoris fuscipes TaxID=488301 RepID=A0AAW1DP21_9HEMI